MKTLITICGACVAAALALPVYGAAEVDWKHAYDFDGDGINDTVEVTFTGGAHCCYRLAVRLTSNGVTHRLPFQLDGGYVGGLDLSQPRRFDIRSTDGNLPELLMEIETYDGKPAPIPDAWQRQYGFRTHYVAVGFAHGQLHVRDWPRAKHDNAHD
jgi:hypothetical protein